MFQRNGNSHAGVGDAAKSAVEQVRNLVKLELELATIELRGKLTAAALAVAFVAGGALAAVLATVFLVAAGTAGIATALPVWAALLVVGGALLLLGGSAALVGVRLLKRAKRALPERAIAEAKRTGEAIRS